LWEIKRMQFGHFMRANLRCWRVKAMAQIASANPRPSQSGMANALRLIVSHIQATKRVPKKKKSINWPRSCRLMRRVS